MPTNLNSSKLTNQYLHKSIYSLLLVLIFLTSCKGQIKTESPIDKPSELKASLTGKAKLTRTQSLSEYQNVECGLQDKQGNIWFGTTGEGVYKYDGELFTQFTMKDGLSSNCIWSILEDNAGNIWFGTSEGICRTKGDEIIRIEINYLIRPVITDNSYYNDWCTKNSVWSMLQDKSGKLWFGTGDGVYCFNGISFSRFLANDGVINKDSLHLKVVADIIEDENGIMWFLSGILPGSEGICRYDGKKIERFKPRDYGWNRYGFINKAGNLIVATRNYGIWTFDGKSFVDYYHPRDLIKSSISYILEDKSGNFWISADYGKEQGDTLGGLWYSSNPAKKPFTKIFNKEVFFIMEDIDRNIWFSTRNMGLYRFDRKTITQYSE